MSIVKVITHLSRAPSSGTSSRPTQHSVSPLSTIIPEFTIAVPSTTESRYCPRDIVRSEETLSGWITPRGKREGRERRKARRATLLSNLNSYGVFGELSRLSRGSTEEWNKSQLAGDRTKLDVNPRGFCLRLLLSIKTFIRVSKCWCSRGNQPIVTLNSRTSALLRPTSGAGLLTPSTPASGRDTESVYVLPAYRYAEAFMAIAWTCVYLTSSSVQSA